MQKKLSVCEFRNHVYTASPSSFIFDTVNQDPPGGTNETIRMKLSFDNVIINLNPNTIFLKSPYASVWFQNVKYVERDEQSLLGAVYNIVCGDPCSDTCTRSYRIIMA